MKGYVPSVFLSLVTILRKSAIVIADPHSTKRFLAKSNSTLQPTSTTATACKGKDEACVPLDFDCCGPYLACDTYTKKCIMENSLKSVAEGRNVVQPASKPGTCKGKGEACAPLDFDCCGPYLACDTYTLKCIMENSLKNIAEGNNTLYTKMNATR